MALPHTRRMHEDQNHEIYAQYKYTDMGYDKISTQINLPRSTVRSVIKRAKMHSSTGNIHDAPRAGRPTKMTDAKRQVIMDIINAQPHLV